MFCKKCDKPCMWNKDLCYECRQEKEKVKWFKHLVFGKNYKKEA